MPLAPDIADFSLPDGWRRVDLPDALGFASVDDLSAARGELRYAHLSLVIQALTLANGESFEHMIEGLMARRVRQGYPGRFQSEVAGLPAYGFDWTDGVAFILSFFVQAPDGSFLELRVCRHAFPQDDVPLEEVARGLLDRVRWRSSLSGDRTHDVLWEVWRQDDGGNRYLISNGHSQSEAERICAEFEARGHKQMYWIAPTRNEVG